MREIKFRGKCLKSSKIVHGSLLKGVGPKSGRWYILPDVVNLASIPYCHPLDGVEVDPGTVGQYSGYKDINGKEIYEGDIITDTVEVDGELVQSSDLVIFDELLGTWMVDHSIKKDRSYCTTLWDHLQDFECIVFGNIHETK